MNYTPMQIEAFEKFLFFYESMHKASNRTEREHYQKHLHGAMSILSAFNLMEAFYQWKENK